MKRFVTSVVALALAIAPFAAEARPAEKHPREKAVAAKIVKHKKAQKTRKAAKADKTGKGEIERHAKADAAERAGLVRVKLGAKRRGTKGVVHHASDVQLGGGHAEPKIERGVTVIPAALAKPARLQRVALTKPARAPEMPQLPPPDAGRPGKVSAEKSAAKKPVEKKHDAEAKDRQCERDEELAELVARIRGRAEEVASAPAKETKAEAKAEAKADPKREPEAEPPIERVKATHGKAAREKPLCLKDPVEIIRGPEVDRFPLLTCDGKPAPLAIEHLSIAVRPGSAARPTTPIAELAKKKGQEIAPGIRRVDEHLPERLQAIVDHFSKPGAPAKLSIVSGYRPTSIGSLHSTGRAVDFRVEGAKNEDVVAFCKTLADTGCGYYPNSSFVHVDVRDSGAGHVHWIDASGPGESPRYVSAWPPPEPPPTRRAPEELETVAAKLDREAPPEIEDEHPSEVTQ